MTPCINFNSMNEYVRVWFLGEVENVRSNITHICSLSVFY